MTFCALSSAKGMDIKMMKKRDYRPKIHFSPEEGWMNDPNGMVYVCLLYTSFPMKQNRKSCRRWRS